VCRVHRTVLHGVLKCLAARTSALAAGSQPVWAKALLLLCLLGVKLMAFSHCLLFRAYRDGFLLFFFQINSVILKEDLRTMVENFYAALFGYDEVRRMFSENVQEQIDHPIHQHRILQMGRTFAVHISGEMLRYGTRLLCYCNHLMPGIEVLVRKKKAHGILI